MINYLFDVDGTLTPARRKMEDEFKAFFGFWTLRQRKKGNKVFLVTGSDREKTKSQIGQAILRTVNGVYQNCGNQLFVRNQLVKESNWKMPASLHLDIVNELEKSRWYGRAEGNIEERVGMVNISTIGREATAQQRREYFVWDEVNEERKHIARSLSFKHRDLDFAIGGEISIDIYPKGKDKSQVLSDMEGKTVFFGDRCEQGGNDFSIAAKSNLFYNVSGYKEVETILQRDYTV
jgi:phosphomannomutase|tara:strand:+ start:22 stop:726 length:705 start_codon:yes stop_codon:yes gene_type:complete